MSFIQCKDKAEVEKLAEEREGVFVTEDHRIYTEIIFSDDGMFMTLNPEKIRRLDRIESHLHMVSYPMHEMSFGAVLRAAESFDKAWREFCAGIGTTPEKLKEESRGA